MSKCSRSWVRFQLTLSLAIALVTTAVSAQNHEARLATFDSSTGETAFALSLTADMGATSSAAKVVIFVDTSASQIAEFREDSFKALKAVLTGLDPQDQVQLYAMDIDPVPLTDSFVAADSSQINVAIQQLNDRLPLGATDIAAMLERSVQALKGNENNKNVIYIGDGVSRGALLATERFESMINDLAKNQIAFSTFAIGPERDIKMLATLANHTGGNVFVDTDDIGSTDQAAAGLVRTVRGTVMWPTRIEKPTEMTEVFPSALPPLRSDRDSILIGSLTQRGQFDVTIHGTINGQATSKTWPVTAEAADRDFGFLPELLVSARESGTLATVGSAGLREVSRLILSSSHEITPLGAAVLNASAPTVVQEEVIDSVPQEDISGGLILQDPAPQANVLPPQAGGGLNLVDQTFDDEQFLREAEGAPDYINNVQGRRRAVEQRLRSYMLNELRISRDLLTTRPDQGIDRLKAMLDTITRAPDIDPAVRLELQRRMQSELRQANLSKQSFDANLALVERGRQAAQARLDLIGQTEAREARLATYFDQFNALLAERNYDGASDVIVAAVSEDLSPETVVAEEFSILRTNWDKYWTLRNQKNRGFLDTLYEVEKSAIPFSGEPPLVFPDADDWLAKKELRKRWQNVRVASNEREERILLALDGDAKFDYFDTRFGDIVDELSADYGIPIQIDPSAFDNNLDEETVISLTLDNVSLRSGLRIILGQFECTYVVKDEVLFIMSEDAALENLVINIYNCLLYTSPSPRD